MPANLAGSASKAPLQFVQQKPTFCSSNSENTPASTASPETGHFSLITFATVSAFSSGGLTGSSVAPRWTRTPGADSAKPATPASDTAVCQR